MKLSSLALPIGVIGILVLSSVAVAQNTDKQKLIDIEKALAANANPSPKTAAMVKEHYYDGPLSFVVTTGLRATLSRSQLVELNSKPSPADPDVKSTQTLSDIRANIYGDTALVNYKVAETDTGHKDSALNGTFHSACLDTFVKRGGRWYVVGGGCSSAAPISQARREAIKKAISHLPMAVQQAIH